VQHGSDVDIERLAAIPPKSQSTVLIKLRLWQSSSAFGSSRAFVEASLDQTAPNVFE
jgi:hypothetical protein